MIFAKNFASALPRATKLLARKDTLAQLADLETVATGLRGPSGPAGGADFLDLHAKIYDFLTIFTIEPYPWAWELPTLETLKLLSFSS